MTRHDRERSKRRTSVENQARCHQYKSGDLAYRPQTAHPPPIVLDILSGSFPQKAGFVRDWLAQTEDEPKEADIEPVQFKQHKSKWTEAAAFPRAGLEGIGRYNDSGMHDRYHRSTKPARERSQDSSLLEENHGMDVMSISSSPYRRRKRRKTKEDRYDVKKPRAKNDIDREHKSRRAAHAKGTTRRQYRTAKRPGEDLMNHFKSRKIADERLTIRPESKLGMFHHGRASSPSRKRRVPDLAFSEMKFLQRSQEGITDKTPLSNNRKRKKMEQQDDDISAYFRREAPTLKVPAYAESRPSRPVTEYNRPCREPVHRSHEPHSAKYNMARSERTITSDSLFVKSQDEDNLESNMQSVHYNEHSRPPARCDGIPASTETFLTWSESDHQPGHTHSRIRMQESPIKNLASYVERAPQIAAVSNGQLVTQSPEIGRDQQTKDQQPLHSERQNNRNELASEHEQDARISAAVAAYKRLIRERSSTADFHEAHPKNSQRSSVEVSDSQREIARPQICYQSPHVPMKRHVDIAVQTDELIEAAALSGQAYVAKERQPRDVLARNAYFRKPSYVMKSGPQIIHHADNFQKSGHTLPLDQVSFEERVVGQDTQVRIENPAPVLDFENDRQEESEPPCYDPKDTINGQYNVEHACMVKPPSIDSKTPLAVPTRTPTAQSITHTNPTTTHEDCYKGTEMSLQNPQSGAVQPSRYVHSPYMIGNKTFQPIEDRNQKTSFEKTQEHSHIHMPIWQSGHTFHAPSDEFEQIAYFPRETNHSNDNYWISPQEVVHTTFGDGPSHGNVTADPCLYDTGNEPDIQRYSDVRYGSGTLFPFLTKPTTSRSLRVSESKDNDEKDVKKKLSNFWKR